MTKDALGELILANERQMFATAKSVLHDDHDCADAIQEAIVKAFTGLSRLRDDRYAKTWLMRILINECHNIQRKSARIVATDDFADLAAENSDSNKPDYSELYLAVAELKEELRVPVILYYMNDFSIKEIADILHISEGAVQKRLARARKLLRKNIHLMEVLI